MSPIADPNWAPSRELYEAGLEHTPAALAIFDREMRYQAVSRKFLVDYRIADAAILGKSHYEVFPDIPERWREAHRRCLAGGVERGEDDPFPRADGTMDWVDWEIRPITAPSGEVTGLVLMSTVVTKQHEARARLEAERQRLAVTLQCIGDAVIATDADARVTILNPEAARLTGWTEGEALGRPLDEVFVIVNEDTRAPCESPVKRALLEGRVVGLANHTLLIARDGTARPISDSASPIRDADRVIGVVLVFRDQTRERAAVEKRHALEEQISRIGASVPGAIFSFGVNARGIACLPFSTAVIEDVLGFSSAVLAEDLAPWREHIHPEDRERVLARVDAAVRDAASWHDLYRYLHPEKGLRWIQGWCAPLVEADGTLSWHGFLSDVTDRRATEAALVQSEDRFRALFDQSSVGMAEVDVQNNRFLRVNQRLCEITGYSREELQSKSWAEITHPDDIEGDRIAFRRMVETRKAYSRAKRYLRPDGEVISVDLSVTPMWAEGEEPRYGVSLIQDTTARRKAEEALTHSVQRFRALIEKSSDILIVLDEEMRVKFWSPSATSQLGWTPEEMLGEHLGKLVAPEHRQRSRADFSAILQNPAEPARFLRRLHHRDGSTRLVEVLVRNLLADPSVQGVVANVHDITDQQQLTEQFQQSQKLESIGRLAGGVAHDFNNLLTVILGSSEALKDDTTAGLPPDIEDIEQIHAAGERARDLTRQLLAFARKQVIDPVTLDLNTVVRGSQKMLGRLLGEDVELRVDLQPGLWSTTGDLGQIEQVIMNLAVNARDAMPRGGTLLLETRNASVEAAQVASNPEHRVGDWVQLVVHDNGAGMSAEILAHVFEPFFTTKEQGKGTGLGLATVYGIVQQAGGHLHVASTVGKGTRFQVCLPRAQRAVATESRGVATTRRTGHETILVAEDDSQVRVLLVRGLREAGYEVLAAATGAEALEIARREPRPIHLLLTDVVMPRGDGRSLADELARMRPGLRVLFVSGYTDDVISHHGVVQSGVDLLQKPFTAATLLERVRRALDR